MFQESSLLLDLLPATSIQDSVPSVFSSSRIVQACITAMWEHKVNCMSIFQASACVTFSDILPKANYVIYPRVRMEYRAKLPVKRYGYGEGEELEPFLKCIPCIYTMSHKYRFITPNLPLHGTQKIIWHTWAKEWACLGISDLGYPRTKGLKY